MLFWNFSCVPRATLLHISNKTTKQINTHLLHRILWISGCCAIDIITPCNILDRDCLPVLDNTDLKRARSNERLKMMCLTHTVFKHYVILQGPPCEVLPTLIHILLNNILINITHLYSYFNCSLNCHGISHKILTVYVPAMFHSDWLDHYFLRHIVTSVYTNLKLYVNHLKVRLSLGLPLWPCMLGMHNVETKRELTLWSPVHLLPPFGAFKRFKSFIREVTGCEDELKKACNLTSRSWTYMLKVILLWCLQTRHNLHQPMAFVQLSWIFHLVFPNTSCPPLVSWWTFHLKPDLIYQHNHSQSPSWCMSQLSVLNMKQWGKKVSITDTFELLQSNSLYNQWAIKTRYHNY